MSELDALDARLGAAERLREQVAALVPRIDAQLEMAARLDVLATTLITLKGEIAELRNELRRGFTSVVAYVDGLTPQTSAPAMSVRPY